MPTHRSVDRHDSSTHADGSAADRERNQRLRDVTVGVRPHAGPPATGREACYLNHITEAKISATSTMKAMKKGSALFWR